MVSVCCEGCRRHRLEMLAWSWRAAFRRSLDSAMPCTPRAGWMLERNGPPSSSSLRCPASGLSLSLDGDLPEGWAIGRGADACRFFMNVFTGERRDARPAAEGAAPAGSPARTGGGVAAAKRGRERDGGAAPPPSLRAAEPTEPSPFVGWLRDKQIMKIRKVMAAAVKKHGPLNKRTKTARAVHRSGYLQGLQGMFARFIFRHAGEETADDPVIPAGERRAAARCCRG